MFIVEIILVLAVACVGVLAGRAAGVPSIVAYVATGLLVGPAGLDLVGHSQSLEQLAEIGVALLLFGVGIEFSLDEFRSALLRMTTVGFLQVGLTILAAVAVYHGAGVTVPRAVFFGFLLSLSSTAIVFKLFDESGEIDSAHGRAATGILLFQDLALVPMMLLLPVLAGAGTFDPLQAGRALVTAFAALAVLLVLARLVLPRGLALAARAGVPEIFPLVAVVMALGMASGVASMGLSLPIGAFLAGLALSGSPYSHQVFAELLPLRDVFVAIFFTSVGMLLDPSAIASQPAAIGAVMGMVLLKAVLIAAIVGAVWRSPRLGILTGLPLAQIGEFSFVLAREGGRRGLIDTATEQAFLGAAVLTMAATPYLITLARRLALAGAERPATGRGTELRNHILVIGYGVTGEAVARVLRETGIRFVAVDALASTVDSGVREGLPVLFGDATRRAVLDEINAAAAAAAVVAVGDPIATRRIVSLLRQANASLRIMVRARRVSEIPELERLGADDVIPSEFETSIELFVRLLTHLGVPRHVVRIQESIIRLGHYQALRGVPVTPDLLAETSKIVAAGILESARVMDGSAACGKTLAELDLRRTTGATVLSLVRDEKPLPPPDGTTRLEAGDLLVLYGSHAAIDRALAVLEPDATRPI